MFVISREIYEVGQHPEQWELDADFKTKLTEAGRASAVDNPGDDDDGINGNALNLQPDGAEYEHSVDAQLGVGWGTTPTPVDSPNNADESMVLLRFGHAGYGLPSKAELLDMGTTLRMWAACFIDGDGGPKSFVSSYVKELRHIPDGMRLSLSDAFSRFDANDDDARAATIAKIEEAKHNKGASAHEREKQEAWAAQEKAAQEKAAREKKEEEERAKN